MASKTELQDTLKKKYGINKNISQSLDEEECAKIILLLSNEPSAAKLIESFTEKNFSLASKNAYFGRMRSQAESKLASLKAEYQAIEDSIKALEVSKKSLEQRKKELEQDKGRLEVEIQDLSSENDRLGVKVKDLTNQNGELFKANDQLKKDNKALKNLIDEIRLRLAMNTKKLLQYEDSELRKAVIKLFKSTLG